MNHNFESHVFMPMMEVTGDERSSYATEFSAGFDIFASEDVTIQPGESALVKTKLKVVRPSNPQFVRVKFATTILDSVYCIEGVAVPELQIRPKSGLAKKKVIMVTNSPGTVDADYPDGIGVLLINMGKVTNS